MIYNDHFYLQFIKHMDLSMEIFFSMINGKKYCIRLGKSLSIMMLPVVMSQYLEIVSYITFNFYSNVLQNW